MYQQNMLMKLIKPILKYTLYKYHVHWLSSFKSSQTANQYKIPACLYLHDSYIIKFDFMNYAFARLVVAW